MPMWSAGAPARHHTYKPPAPVSEERIFELHSRAKPLMLARLPLLGLLVALAAGCNPNAFRTMLKGEATIRGNPLGGLLGAFPAIGSFTNIDFSQNQDFRSEGADKSQVSSVKVETLWLQIQSPSHQDFSFLESLSFFARASDDEVLIAERHAISSLGLEPPSPRLMLETQGAELQPYVTAPQMSIVVRGRGQAPPQDTRIEVGVTLRVELDLLQ
jgi:hypothetical protein